ncbi:PH domain-containing protein [Corynebacterium alimapuense]|nr:PH domain-containing protein [Corynebacterium alimapuense]
MSSEAADAESVQFRPDRANILAALLMIAIALLVVGAAPVYLFWVLAIPVLFIYWILRSSTTVDEQGVSIKYAFRGGKTVEWEDLSGVGFKGSRALLTTTEGKEYPMPGVTFNSLPKLSEASSGRIPDALTAGRIAADEKVVVINRDGEQILLTKEEYAARQTDKAAEADSENPRSNQ